jgi:pyruvate/2-oxoglutarate/acetoin dehydrogenase E1 component
MPLVVRTPMGGRRGYGPTHSQTLEKHFMGVPGLGVFAPCSLLTGRASHPDLGGRASHPDLGGPGELLYRLVTQSDGPVLFVENKLQYLLPVLDDTALADFELQVNTDEVPCYTLTIRAAPPPVITLAAYGYMSELARQAQLRLAYEAEIFTELVVVTQLAPFALKPVLDSAARTTRLLAVEEGALSLGWGAEVLAQAVETLGSRLHSAGRLAALDLPVPAAPSLEQAVLPGVEDIIQKVKKMV